MSNFVNGYKSFTFITENPDTGQKYYYPFEFKFRALKEFINEHYTEHNLLIGTTAQEFERFTYSWEIYYTRIQKSQLLMFRNIHIDQSRGWNIYLIPRIDRPSRKFKVISVKENWQLLIGGGGQYAQGMREFTLKYRSNDLSKLKTLDIQDPDVSDLIGLGFPNKIAI